MKSDWYIYPIRISYADQGILVTFPDFPRLWVHAKNEEEAIQKAKMIVGQHLVALERSAQEKEIPIPTPFGRVNVGQNEICTLIEVYLWHYRDNVQNSFIEKNILIPTWLGLSINDDINLSQILEDGLRKYFGIEVQE